MLKQSISSDSSNRAVSLRRWAFNFWIKTTRCQLQISILARTRPNWDITSPSHCLYHAHYNTGFCFSCLFHSMGVTPSLKRFQAINSLPLQPATDNIGSRSVVCRLLSLTRPWFTARGLHRYWFNGCSDGVKHVNSETVEQSDLQT